MTILICCRRLEEILNDVFPEYFTEWKNLQKVDWGRLFADYQPFFTDWEGLVLKLENYLPTVNTQKKRSGRPRKYRSRL